MFRTFSLTNYRGFADFKLEGLGRINLLVGTNNSGKTSLLEAVGLLASGGDLGRLWSTMDSRGEWLVHERPPRREASSLALPFLFHGYRATFGSRIQLRAARFDTASASEAELTLEVGELSDEAPPPRQRRRPRTLAPGDPGDGESRPIIASLDLWRHAERIHRIPISEGWGIVADDFYAYARDQGSGDPVQVITTESMTPQEVVNLVDRIQLTEEEEHVLRALRIIDPRILHFRPTLTRLPHYYNSPNSNRYGVILKLEGVQAVLPIGTLGDGSWRILGLALALAAAKGGVLLVDEIDTGLYHGVMAEMWRLVADTASRLDVQVFATSHSRDCIDSLAAIADTTASERERITIHRIEPERDTSVLFTDQDILNAAKHDLELR